jgi:hypothetical protein
VSEDDQAGERSRLKNTAAAGSTLRFKQNKAGYARIS